MPYVEAPPLYISHYSLIKFQKTPTLTTTQICSCVILMTYYIHPMSQFVCNPVSHLIFQPSHSRSSHIQGNIVGPSKSHKSALGKGQRTRKTLQFQNGFGFGDSGTYQQMSSSLNPKNILNLSIFFVNISGIYSKKT